MPLNIPGTGTMWYRFAIRAPSEFFKRTPRATSPLILALIVASERPVFSSSCPRTGTFAHPSGSECRRMAIRISFSSASRVERSMICLIVGYSFLLLIGVCLFCRGSFRSHSQIRSGTCQRSLTSLSLVLERKERPLRCRRSLKLFDSHLAVFENVLQNIEGTLDRRHLLWRNDLDSAAPAKDLKPGLE